jgi:hypothetical protein
MRTIISPPFLIFSLNKNPLVVPPAIKASRNNPLPRITQRNLCENARYVHPRPCLYIGQMLDSMSG